jgi:hypothetical protein
MMREMDKQRQIEVMGRIGVRIKTISDGNIYGGDVVFEKMPSKEEAIEAVTALVIQAYKAHDEEAEKRLKELQE